MIRNTRLKLLLVFAVFLLPLLLAWLMFRGIVDLDPAGNDNEGRLVIPPEPLAWDTATIGEPVAGAPGLDGAWVVLYPLPDPCAPDCIERVRALHGVHRATGRLADRVRIAVLADPAADQQTIWLLRDIDPQIYLLRNPRPEFDAALRRTGAGAAQPSVYLVDPLGNIMMTYDAGDSMTKLLKDLKKLLTWSKPDGRP
jgi:hypothetical protein